MKSLKKACIILGILSFVIFFLYNGIFFSPQTGGIRNYHYYETLANLFVIFILIPAGIVCGIIAWKLNRSPIIYGLLGLFAPFVTCFVIPFLKVREDQVTVTKTCSSCNKAVSELSRPGQKCPHCGIVWDYENNLTETRGGFSSLNRLLKW